LVRPTGRRAGLAVLLFLLHGTAPAQPPGETLPERVQACTGCHGSDGVSRIPGIPSIAGQPKIFLENLLVLVREGVRGTETMQKIMHGATDREIIALAKHFSALPARRAPGATDAALVKRGRRVAAKLRCGICHLKDFSGQNQVPRLAGQREEYLVSIMVALRDKPPPGMDTQMSAALYGVSDADIRALAHYLARVN